MSPLLLSLLLLVARPQTWVCTPTACTVELDEYGSVPSTPAANRVKVYAKDVAGVSHLFYKDDAGVEHDLGAAGGGGAPTTAKYVTGADDAGLSADIFPSGDDMVPVSDSSSAATWRSLPACTDTGGNHVNYDRASNSFSCGTTTSSPAVPTGTGYWHITAGASDAASKLVNLTAASDVAANQGTTTTLFHGNGAGQGSFGPVVSADITDATVAYADIQNIAGLSVMGRSANSSGVGADITGTAGQVLRVSGVSVLGFGTVDLTSAAAVTGVLPLANGGTNSNAAASNGAVIYSDATKFAESAVGTLAQGLYSGGAGTPTWVDDTKVVRLTSDYTNATTSLTNTALTWTSPSSVSRSGFYCELMIHQSATTLGTQVDVNVATAPTTISYEYTWVIGLGTTPATSGTKGFVGANANATLVGNTAGLTANSISILTGVIVHTSTSTAVTVRARASSAGTTTIVSGSYCVYYVL